MWLSRSFWRQILPVARRRPRLPREQLKSVEIMPVQCPNCGSRFLRESKPRDASEKLAQWRFVSPLRCLDCKTRFVASTLSLGDIRWAHCPKCDRMDLNQWTGKNYEPPFLVGLMVSFGANRWRCEYCRINFASFRKRKEVFTFKRWKNLKSGDAVAQGRARLAEMEAKAQEVRELEEAEALAQARAEAEELAREEAELRMREKAELLASGKANTKKKDVPDLVEPPVSGEKALRVLPGLKAAVVVSGPTVSPKVPEPKPPVNTGDESHRQETTPNEPGQ